MGKPFGVDDTLLGASSVYLFGRVLSDLTVKTNDSADGDRPKKKGKNKFLEQQLRKRDANLARIFSFAFEGSFYELARPTIFLVHGFGEDPDVPPPGDRRLDRLARSPGRVTRTGVGRQFGAFSMDMKVWIYDKGDFSLRLDAETGTFEQILLEIEASADPGGSFGGGLARSSGARSSGARSSGARSSGVMARSSGWLPRDWGKDD